MGDHAAARTGLRNLDLDLVRAFVAIADSRSFTRAAARLARTQSTVSLQLKRLEDTLGARLFERTPRAVTLTAEGEAVLPAARRLLALNDEMVAKLLQSDVHGTVRLGTPEDFATTHLPHVLARFAESYPAVSLEVTCDLTLNLLDRFRAGEFDLVLIKREPIGPMAGTRVWREALVWAAADHAHFESEVPLPLVVSPHPCVYRRRATQALDRARRRWRVAYTSTSLAGAQAAVRARLGVTVLPKDMVPADFVVVESEAGMPDLHETEVALLHGESLPRPAERLAEHIVRALERER